MFFEVFIKKIIVGDYPGIYTDGFSPAGPSQMLKKP